MTNSATRAMYSRLASAYASEPAVPDRGGGVAGDKYPLGEKGTEGQVEYRENSEDYPVIKDLPRSRMVTLKEAAVALRMKPGTLRQQAGRGILKAKKQGRDWVVSPIEVDRYAAIHRRNRVN